MQPRHRGRSGVAAVLLLAHGVGSCCVSDCQPVQRRSHCGSLWPSLWLPDFLLRLFLPAAVSPGLVTGNQIRVTLAARPSVTYLVPLVPRASHYRQLLRIKAATADISAPLIVASAHSVLTASRQHCSQPRIRQNEAKVAVADQMPLL